MSDPPTALALERTSTTAVDAMVGLTTAEAAQRLRRDGPNRLPPPARRSPLGRFLGQLVHFFALLLWVAAGLALVAGLPQLSVAISLVVVLNAAFAFAQETKATRAADRLRELLPDAVTVQRDGWPQRVRAVDVVRGDWLLLEAGDRVPADGTLVEAHGLTLDTSLLTGESATATTEAPDGIFAGTFVVEGAGAATVTATGRGTRLARIAALTTGTPAPPSPLAVELHHVVRAVAWIAIGVGALFLVISMLIGDPLSQAFVFAVGVTVALVPEALLPTVTLSLAWAAERMAERQVLVRNLEAVETLGSTTFICTDKTGTLTRNQMTVVEAWTPTGSLMGADPGYDPAGSVEVIAEAESLAELARSAVLCSSGFVHEVDGRWTPFGEPMEAAIDVLARRLGIDTDADRSRTPIRARFPFDPRRRRMSVITGDRVIVKGAPDSVLPLCAPVAGAAEVLHEYMARGLRVLAVASRDATGPCVDQAAAECDLTLDGLVALQDPPRAGARAAIDACRCAGVRVGMVTGDHLETAEAIADQVGLALPGAPRLTGDELPSSDEVLGHLLDRDGAVVARVSPEQKLRIARALRARGHVVAMTGDGVNDGPALHEADIGVAMGMSGTDVAREAADLVLLDDDFASIVRGIELGRGAYLNVRRFLTYHLTDNVAELAPFVVWALSGGRFPLALGVLQILALDIGTDTLTAVALGAEPPPRDALHREPVTGRLLNRRVVWRAFGVLGPTEAALALTAFLVSYLAAGWRPGDVFVEGATLATASGAAFLAVVLAQSMNAFACRSSSRTIREVGWRANRLLPIAVAIGLLISLAAVTIRPLAHELGHRLPSVAGWTVVALAPAALFAVDTLEKRRHRSSGP